MIILTLTDSSEYSAEVPVEIDTLPGYTRHISISGDSQSTHIYAAKILCNTTVHNCDKALTYSVCIHRNMHKLNWLDGRLSKVQNCSACIRCLGMCKVSRYV